MNGWHGNLGLRLMYFHDSTLAYHKKDRIYKMNRIVFIAKFAIIVPCFPDVFILPDLPWLGGLLKS
jgi:hypothetical protein